MNEAIPIMFGPHPDDVKRVAPPNSFIHAEEFDSIDDRRIWSFTRGRIFTQLGS
jgi:hypothetical protein